MENQKKVGFNLVKVSTEQFAIIDSAFSNSQKTEYKTHVDFAINEKNNGVGVFTSFELKNEDKIFMVLKVASHFIVEPEAWKSFLSEDLNKLVLPKNFLAHLTAIAISTSRGILHAKTENTKFNHFLLPLLNVSEIIKVDAVFDLPKEIK